MRSSRFCLQCGSWRTQSRLPSSYVSDDLRERHDDIIWRIRWGKDWLYVYLLLDEGSYHDHELATLRNLTAALFRLENSRTPEDVQQILQALIIWLQSPEQSRLRRTFTIWLKRVFLPGRMPKVRFDEVKDLQEVRNMLLEQSKIWTENWKQEGIEEGLQKGRQEGEAELLLRLLERRFGPVDETIRTRIRAADSQTLLTWGEQILTAQTIEEVFEA